MQQYTGNYNKILKYLNHFIKFNTVINVYYFNCITININYCFIKKSIKNWEKLVLKHILYIVVLHYLTKFKGERR